MAKRLTDSRKWDDDWFISLDPKYQLLWIYMCDKCNHSGIFKPSLQLAGFCTHADFETTEVLRVFKDRVIELSPTKWFLPKFVSFQYGVLNPNRPVCKSVISSLKTELSEELFDRFVVPYLIIEQSLMNDTPIIKTKSKSISKTTATTKEGGMGGTDFISTLKTNIAYKHINLDVELAKMDVWLSRPANKGRKKTERFVLNWLNKIEQPIEKQERKLVPL